MKAIDIALLANRIFDTLIQNNALRNFPREVVPYWHDLCRDLVQHTPPSLFAQSLDHLSFVIMKQNLLRLAVRRCWFESVASAVQYDQHLTRENTEIIKEETQQLDGVLNTLKHQLDQELITRADACRMINAEAQALVCFGNLLDDEVQEVLNESGETIETFLLIHPEYLLDWHLNWL